HYLVPLGASIQYSMRVRLLTVTQTSKKSTLSLHDALPIFADRLAEEQLGVGADGRSPLVRVILVLDEGRLDAELAQGVLEQVVGDRKSTRLNSSHVKISYAVFCLKKKNITYRYMDVNNTIR